MSRPQHLAIFATVELGHFECFANTLDIRRSETRQLTHSNSAPRNRNCTVVNDRVNGKGITAVISMRPIAYVTQVAGSSSDIIHVNPKRVS
jgi:hypothetical protein